MDKQKLSTDGLLKILPILEEIAEEMYSDCGGVNIRVHHDGNLRIDVENPMLLMNEAAENNIELVYLGKDKYGENCFEARVPIMELQPLAGPGVAAPSPQSATPNKSIGTPQPTQQDSPDSPQQPQAQPNQEQMVQAVMAQIMPEIEKQVGDMMQNFAKKTQKFWKSGSKSTL